jgi:hypothetical protein
VDNNTLGIDLSPLFVTIVLNQMKRVVTHIADRLSFLTLRLGFLLSYVRYSMSLFYAILMPHLYAQKPQYTYNFTSPQTVREQFTNIHEQFIVLISNFLKTILRLRS